MKLRRRHKYVGVALCATLAGFALRGMEASNRLHRDTAQASVDSVMAQSALFLVPAAAPSRPATVAPARPAVPARNAAHSGLTG